MFQGWRGADDGEAEPTALLVGSALFLLGGLAIGGVLTMSMATATRAQANADLTHSMATYVSEWQSSPYSAFAATTDRQSVALKSGSRTVEAQYTVTKSAHGAYHLAIAAPRWTELGVRQADCMTALTKPVATCLTLSATVTPTPFDVVPPAPEGLTIVNRAAVDGVVIADLDVAKLTAGKAMELRLAVKVRPGVDTSAWQAVEDCGTPTAGTTDSPFMAPDISGWGSASLTVKPGTGCLLATVRLRSAATPQPQATDVQEVRAFHVLGAGS